MKKIAFLLILCIAVSILCIAASAETLETGTLLRPETADPWMFSSDGKYYLTSTDSTRVAVYESENLADLYDMSTEQNISYIGYYGDYTDPAVYELFGDGATIDEAWSPEIHYFSEEEFPGNSGWYMFVALRKETGDSSMMRMVVLKSTTDSPLGPYGHPTKGTENYSQPVLNENGDIYDEWACGQTVLRISEGEHAGIYAMWVAEEGRGQPGTDGTFHQKIMIAKMSSPWQLAGEPGIITTPTQAWEQASGSSTHPQVVEGATAVYGRNGDVFLVYSGSGYWTNCALGQLTWTGEDPLETASWIKLDESKNPILDASTSTDLRGAGHASFLTDTNGNGFAVYHAYPYEDGTKASSRNAYIEPYYIDYTEGNGVGKGVVHIGLNDNGVTAPTTSTIDFVTSGTALTAPEVYTVPASSSIKLTPAETNADGYTIYGSTDGETFEYLATVARGTSYTDTGLAYGNTYYYRVYALREEEIGPASKIISRKTSTCAPHTLSAASTGSTVTVSVQALDNYESVCLYRSDDGRSYSVVAEQTNVTNGETLTFTDTVTKSGTYSYMATGVNFGYESFPAGTVSVEVTDVVAAPAVKTKVLSGTLFVGCDLDEEYTLIKLYRSADGKSFTEWRDLDNVDDTDASAYYIGDSDIVYGETYYYYAIGYIGEEASKPSETVSYTVDFLPAPSFRSISYTCQKVSFGWPDQPNCDTHIYRSSDGGETYTEIATVQGNTYTDTGITVGVEYKYKMQFTREELGLESEFSICFIPIIPKHREDLTEYPAKDATCTEDGYTAYTCCQYCGTVISGKEVIPASHSYEVTEAMVPATTTSEGKTAVYTCTVCQGSYGGEVIPMLKTIMGDVSGDGKLSLVDLLRVLKAISGKITVDMSVADMNGDSMLTVADVMLIIHAYLD